MPSKYTCPECRKDVTGTKMDKYRSHTYEGEVCEMSGAPIPEHILDQPVGDQEQPDVPREGVDYSTCPQCDRKVKLTQLGYFDTHTTTLRGDERCPVSGVRAKHARKTTDVLLPGDAASTAPTETADPTATETTSEESPTPASGSDAVKPRKSSPSSGSTNTSPKSDGGSSDSSTSSDAGAESADVGPWMVAPLLGDGSVLQPFSHISQPFPVPPRVTLKQALTDDAKQVVTRFKETFFSYNNRRSSDNRGAQETLGPSEIGHECDRRLAMSLMGIPRVNPGGDGWAAWIGTQGHRGLEEMFNWASARSGRYATELKLTFPSKFVPKGTLDLLDRTVNEVGDFKFMGEYSLKKLIQNGPPAHYRTQLQVYGLGAELAGEKVRSVALYGLPRAGSSLDGMYVWTAPYDRKEAQAALDRVDRIAAEIDRKHQQETGNAMEVAREFSIDGAECRFCQFHLKGDKQMERGCPGKV